MQLISTLSKIARDDYMKLKGIRYNELLKEEEWFPRKSRESKYPLTYEDKADFIQKI